MKKRSPLKEKPLRQAGDSIREELQRQWDDKFEPYIVATVLLWFMALMFLWQKLTSSPPQPILFAIIATGATGIAAYKLRREIQSRRQLLRGLEGELAVGQELEKLRAQGYEVFHDLPGDSFNVDHVVVGPRGIFTIETKTVSKPEKGKAIVQYDGQEVLVNGLAPDRDPIIQAKSQARWLRKLLKDVTTTEYAVRPVVIYPGWFVEGNQWRAEVWVLHHEAFAKFLANENPALNHADIASISDAIKRHVRAAPAPGVA